MNFIDTGFAFEALLTGCTNEPANEAPVWDNTIAAHWSPLTALGKNQLIASPLNPQ